MSSVMKTIYFKCFVKLNGCFRWNSKSSPCDSVLARSFLWLSLVYILRSGLKLGGQIALICDIILTTTTRAKGSRVSLVFLRSPFCDFDHFSVPLRGFKSSFCDLLAVWSWSSLCLSVLRCPLSVLSDVLNLLPDMHLHSTTLTSFLLLRKNDLCSQHKPICLLSYC